jgi:magnesium chelatase subunit D
MVEALLLLGVDPSIGGLLLMGEKGTGKSTAARALAEILPDILSYPCPYHCDPHTPHLLCEECRKNPQTPSLIRPPFKTLPLGVTEERLLGGLDFELTMREGRPIMRPGILGEANNGLIYIDEVNLLDPQLAHLLLDAASCGRVSVERDGFSYTHPSRVALLGSMNPEEGPLGPQLSDRFALMVELKGEIDLAKRSEIIKRRLSFEKNPLAFREIYKTQSQGLKDKLKRGRLALPTLTLSPEARKRASDISKSSGTHGHRADLALCLAARAKYALDIGISDSEIGPEWIDSVEHLVIPARRSLNPHKRLKKEVEREIVDLSNKSSTSEDPDFVYVLSTDEVPPDFNYQSFDPDERALLRVFQTGETYNIITPKLPKEKGLKEQKGRRSFRESQKARGRAFKTTARRLGRPLSLSATLRAAAPHQRQRAKESENG